MIDYETLNIQLIILLPVATALLLPLFTNKPNLRETISLFAGIILLLACINLYTNFDTSAQQPVVWLTLFSHLTISFSVEPLGLIFALMSSFLWFITTIYAIGYMRHHREKNQTRFYQFFSLTMATVMGIAFANNLFTLYIFYELLTLATFPLVIHAGSHKAKLGGRTYLAVLLSTSFLFFLPAMIATWFITGQLDFELGGVFSQIDTSSTTISVLLFLFVLGIGKAAIMPFHRWLPAAMVAPTPVSALLHAVAVVKAGVFAMLKVCIFIFGENLITELPSTQILLYLAGLSVFIASLVAMRQDNLKKRLAYSTVSQLGYITIGTLLASKTGIIASAMHIAIHGFSKITLFFCAGAIIVISGKTKVSELAGLGQKMPITMTAFFIASLSIIGLPPLAGAWSKWWLLLATFEKQQWLLMLVLALSSLMNIFYLLTIPLTAFFTKSNQAVLSQKTLEAPLPILIAIITCTCMCFVIFLFPQPLYELAANIVPNASN